MANRVACLRCSHTFTPREGQPGKKQPCPKCGSDLHVELFSASGLSGPLSFEQVPDDAAGASQPAPPPKRTSGPGEPAASTPAGEKDPPPLPETIAPLARTVAPERSPTRPSFPRWIWWTSAAAALVLLAWWGVHLAFGPADPTPTSVATPSEQETPEPSEPDRAPPPDPEEPDGQQTVEEPSVGEPPVDEESGTGPEEAAPPEEEVKYAVSLEEITEAVVKFEMPIGVGDLKQYGAGFLIDPRGWVATNHHVVASVTKASRVKLFDGTRLAIEGIVARAPERDLAIVKLALPSPPSTVLDIGFDGTPSLGEQVFAVGHPYNADFSLTKGIVSRVLTTKQLLDNSPQQVVTKIRAPADLVWIQHDAKISPGNSGGPLVDEAGRVVGINTFVHLKAEFGYASHVQYLRELAATAPDRLEPVPEARDLVRTVVSTGRMGQLVQAAAAFGWKPDQAGQYEQLAELAKQWTLAKHAQVTSAAAARGTPKAVQNVAAFADRQFATMRQVGWTKQHFDAVNVFAGDQVDKVGQGAVLSTIVLGGLRGRDALVMEIVGTEKRILVRVGPKLAKLPRGTRSLVFGFVTPQVARVESRDRKVSHPVRVLLTHYMLLVR